MRKIIIAIACTAALFVMVPVALFAALLITFWPAPDPPPSAQSPLIYTGAENVARTEESGYLGTRIESVTFQALDKAEVIFAFYSNLLKEEGWVLQSVRPYKEGYTLVMVGASKGQATDPTFYFEVEARAMVAGKTDVEVTLVTYPIR